MKKLFFFRSSQSSSGNSTVSPPLPEKQTSENASGSGSSPCLRRSASYTSADFYDGVLGQKDLSCLSGSPCRSSHGSPKRSDRRSSRSRTLTPRRQSKAKYFEVVAVQNAHDKENPASDAFVTRDESSDSSSYCSSNISTKVLDRYIDGEQQRGDRNNNSSQRYPFENRNGGANCPRRGQYIAPASPTDRVKEKLKPRSFRESKGTNLCFPSKDRVENGYEHKSPRRLAKHVVERLSSQSCALPKTSSKEFDPDVPITIEDIYGGSLNRWYSQTSDGFSEKSCLRDDYGTLKRMENEEGIDVELRKKSKEAEERAMVVSEELDPGNFLQDIGFSVPELIQNIRNLTEEKLSMALEVSAVLQDRIADRDSAKNELRRVKSEFDSRTRKLEKEKKELQAALEKELDRRSSEWSFNLEKYQAEEQRLRERVRELAEQNVSLQREVSSFSECDTEIRSRLTHSELQFKDLTKENQNLQQDFSGLLQKCRAAEEDRDCIQRNYGEKEKECMDLHKSITRLLRTCSEQEKTIDGLREGLNEEVTKKSFMEKSDKKLEKLNREQMRLTGVERVLRKEMESYRLEVDSLRHENINLLHRLKESGKEGGFSTFKLDQELQSRVCSLQNQGIGLIDESTRLCSKLLDYAKEKAGQSPETKQGIEVVNNGLDGQFVVEADVKVQGFKRGIETLRRSLETVAVVLHEKSNLASLNSHSNCLKDESGQLNGPIFEDAMRSELKAETLVTSLLREKLYCKEMDVEQLQAELAVAVRGNDVLRCEVQSALDNISCLTHKMKDLELQIIKRDENTYQVQNELQECRKEVTVMKGILPKVSEERDLMWEEVKQYSEKNMLLNSEVNVLKRKMDALEEDVLLKEGQIAILKDTIGKPFDLLVTPDSMRQFRMQ